MKTWLKYKDVVKMNAKIHVFAKTDKRRIQEPV